MGSKSDTPPLIVIVGETASGKSSLALHMAQKWHGEIVAADSRTVYLGMDIGTAKPTLQDRSKVPHHLIDIAKPDQPVTAADFKRLANQSIADITHRDRVAFMAGGSGLYVDAVVFDYSFATKADEQQRALLQALSVEELQQKLLAKAIPLPRNDKNKRHLIRQIETGGIVAGPRNLRYNTLMIGSYREKADMAVRIERRVDAMLSAGLEAEVKSLVALYGWSTPALQTIGYQEFEDYFEGDNTIDQVRARIIKSTKGLAKRQRTWFKRNSRIHWICSTEEADDLITTFLNK